MVWVMLKGLLVFVLSMGFWVAVDGIQAAPPHMPYAMFDARSLWGLIAWSCAILVGTLLGSSWSIS